MKTPKIFSGQPVWATLLIILSYLLLGPRMQDDGPPIERPPPLRTDQIMIILVWLLLALIGIGVFVQLRWNCVEAMFGAIVWSTPLTLIALRKRVVRVLVNGYQRRAPSEVRCLCKQTPSCSEYFLLSVEKYGVLRGALQGWRRLKTCNGITREDWP
jgi:putative component of membrane protein insertase Oxa1/YidC/SpoIIIJ protein YidD